MRREIEEETGFRDYTIHKPIAWGDHLLEWDNFPTRFLETFYAVSTPEDAPHMEQLTHEEKQVVKQLSWWTFDELKKTQAFVYPTGLVDLLKYDWDQLKEPIQIEM